MECLKNKPKYVVFHPGIPHGDDMFTGGIYKFFFGDISFYRREPTKKELQDPLVHVCDVGLSFNKKLNNYDHHQKGKELPSTCILVWNALMPEYTEELRLIKRIVQKHILNKISDGDKGILTGDIDGQFLRNYSNSFNSHDEGFDAASEVCYQIILGKVSSILKTEKLSKKWKTFKTFGNSLIVYIDDMLDFVPEDFKQKASEVGVRYIVLKEHTRKMTAVLYSLNGTIPSDTKRQKEYSGDGRTATYTDAQNAINHALELSLIH